MSVIKQKLAERDAECISLHDTITLITRSDGVSYQEAARWLKSAIPDTEDFFFCEHGEEVGWVCSSIEHDREYSYDGHTDQTVRKPIFNLLGFAARDGNPENYNRWGPGPELKEFKAYGFHRDQITTFLLKQGIKTAPENIANDDVPGTDLSMVSPEAQRAYSAEIEAYRAEVERLHGENNLLTRELERLNRHSSDIPSAETKQREEMPGYSTPVLAVLNAAITEFFEPRRNPDAKREEVVKWIKSKMLDAGLADSDNIAAAIFTIIKPENHDPKKRRG